MGLRRLSLFMPGGLFGRHQVLCFHRVLEKPDLMMPCEPDVGLFEKRIARLRRDFNIIPLSEAVRRVPRGSLPSASLSITFDDGYADNFSQALPVLERHQVPATFFVATGFLDGGRMWNDTLIETARLLPDGQMSDPFAEDGVISIRNFDDRRELAQRAIDFCKHLPQEERERRVAQFAELQNQPLPRSLMMTSEQVGIMGRSDYADIGAHTVSHPILANCSDEVAAREISRSVDDLTQILGAPPSLFAYPNGKPGRDFLPDQAAIVKQQGLEAAVTTEWGVFNRGTDPYRIPRFGPWSKDLNRFVLEIVRARYGLL